MYVKKQQINTSHSKTYKLWRNLSIIIIFQTKIILIKHFCIQKRFKSKRVGK